MLWCQPFHALPSSCVAAVTTVCVRHERQSAQVRTLRSGGRAFRDKIKAACGALVWTAGFWQFIVSTCQLLQPLVVRALVLAAMDDGPAARTRALKVTGYIAALTIVQAFAQQRRPGRDPSVAAPWRSGVRTDRRTITRACRSV